MRLLDLAKQEFGKWIVKQRHIGTPHRNQTGAFWDCVCKCGRTGIVSSSALRSGTSTKCKHCARFGGTGEISRYLWYRIERNARARHIPVSLTIEQAWELFLAQGRKCALTGTSIKFANQSVTNTTSSLDRIRSDQGYVVGNVQWVHKVVNLMKNILSEPEFVLWCCRVAHHHQTNEQQDWSI